MKAYDLEILRNTISENDPRGNGWVYGLPPGVRPEQWPRDLLNEYPLQHGFTLLLPEAYRRRRKDLVAISFFGPDLEDEVDTRVSAFKRLCKALSLEVPKTVEGKLDLWKLEGNHHPEEVRLFDELNAAYSVIFLTKQEFLGPFCSIPTVTPNTYQQAATLNGLSYTPLTPQWVKEGAARAMVSNQLPIAEIEQNDALIEKYYLTRTLGCLPPPLPSFNRAIGLRVRENDPNVGLVPVESWDEKEGGYHYPAKPDPAWQNEHLGGTMAPLQEVPDVTPFYMEFSETFGGFNFGDGKAWLDLENNAFGWAC